MFSRLKHTFTHSLLVVVLSTLLSPLVTAENLPQPVPDASRATLPYEAVGLVRTDFNGPDEAIVGSGSAVGDKVVLTAGHVFFEASIGAWNRGQWYWDDAATPAALNTAPISGEMSPRSYRVLAGYTNAAVASGQNSDAAFGRDSMTLIFYEPVAAGKQLQVVPGLLTQELPKMAVGYPAEIHGTQVPLGQMSASGQTSASLTPIDGSTVFYQSSDLVTGFGASGGPLLVQDGGVWKVGGVIIAKNQQDLLAAREIDSDAQDMIAQSITDTSSTTPGNLAWSVTAQAGIELSDGSYFLQSGTNVVRMDRDGNTLVSTPSSYHTNFVEMPDGEILAFDQSNATLLQRSDGAPLKTMYIGGQLAPAVGEDGIIYGVESLDGIVSASYEGTVLWKVQPEPASERPSFGQGVAFGPVIGLDGVIRTLIDGRLYAINTDGTTAWRTDPIPGIKYSTLAIAPDGSTLVSTGANLLAYAPNGDLRWNLAVPGLTNLGVSAIGSDGTIYAQNINVYLPQDLLVAVSSAGVATATYSDNQGTLIELKKGGGWITLDGLQSLHSYDSAGKELWSRPNESSLICFGAQVSQILCQNATFYTPLVEAIATESAGDPGAWYGTDGAQNHARRSYFTHPMAPVIVTGPASAKFIKGTAITLTVDARGSQLMRYEWYKDGVILPTQVGARLVIPSAAATDSGSYTVKVLNPAGSVTSAAVQVTVADASGGVLLWTIDRNRLSLPSAAPDGTSYVVFSGNNPGIDNTKGLLTAITPGGLLSWSYALDANDMDSASIQYKSPVVGDDGTICVASNNLAYGITPAGALLWKVQLPITAETSTGATLLLGGNHDVFAVTDGSVNCIGLDGTLRWSKNTGYRYDYMGEIVTNDGHLVLTYSDNSVSQDSVVEYTDDGSAVWSHNGQGLGALGAVQSDGSILSASSVKVPAWTNDPNAPLSDYGAIAVIDSNGTLRYKFQGSFGPMAITADGGLATDDGHFYPLNGGAASSLFAVGVSSKLIGYSTDGSLCYGILANGSYEVRSVSETGELVHSFSATSQGPYVYTSDGRLVGGYPFGAYQAFSYPGKTAWPTPLADAQCSLRSPASPPPIMASAMATPSISLVSGAYQGYDLHLQFLPSGAGIISVQWQNNGVDIPGAVSDDLEISNIGAAQNGQYRLAITTPAGIFLSNVVDVSVSPPVPVTAGYYTGTFTNLGYSNDFAAVVDENRVCTAYIKGQSIGAAKVGPDGVAWVPYYFAGNISFSELVFSPGLVSVDGVSGADLKLDSAAAEPGLAVLPGVYRGRSAPTADPNVVVILAPNGRLFASGYEPDSPQVSVRFDSFSTDGKLAAGETNIDLSTVGSVDKLMLSFSPDQRCRVNISGGLADQSRVVDAELATRPENEHLVAISTRGNVGPATMTAGFVIAGTVPQTVLIRAIGPTLKEYSISAPLPHAHLELFDAQQKSIAVNTGWDQSANAADVSAASVRLGAFPLKPGSGDAALLVTLNPGLYTAIVSSADGGSGVTLVEVYDGQSSAVPANRVVDIATLGRVASGQNALVAGISISGGAKKTVLIRAVGPSLSAYLPGSTLCADPVLTVYDAKQNVVATNDTWGFYRSDNAAITAADAKVNAFPLTDAHDAAVLVSLDPGLYTVEVTCPAGMEGTGLVEVYDIPPDF